MQQDQRDPLGLYGRTSKDDPRTVTIENQKDTLRFWASTDKQTGAVREYWDEGVSGTVPIWERPAGRKLFDDLRSGKTRSVAVAYADRFGRTLREGLNAVKDLEDAGAKLICVNEGWDARRADSPLYMQFRFMMAEEEWRRIRDRTETGKKRAMERDNAPPGGPLTFGYTTDTHGRFVPDPVEAAIVIQIFSMFLAGDPYEKILAWIKTTGIKSGMRHQCRLPGSLPSIRKCDENATWHRNRIGRILRNRTYTGERKWGSRTFPCVPLIDPDTFIAVQALLESKPNGKGGSDPAKCLLSGLFRCSLCNKAYHRKPQTCKRRSGKIHVYQRYVCDGANVSRRNGPPCHGKIIPIAWLDKFVWDNIEEYIRNPEEMIRRILATDGVIAKKADLIAGSAEAIKSAIEAIDLQVNDIWAEQRANGWPISWVTPQLNQLNTERDRLLKQAERIRQEQAAISLGRQDSMSVMSEIARLRSLLDSGLSPEAKHRFIRRVWSSGVIRTIGEGHKKTAEIKFELKWGDLVEESVTRSGTQDRSHVTDSITTVPFTLAFGRIA